MRDDELFQDTVTLYNRFSQGQPPFPPTVGYNRTVIKGVSWKDKINTNQASDGKSFIDQTVSITIPLEAECRKKYINPKEYIKLTDFDEHWTLNIDPANPDIITYGESPEIEGAYTIAQLRRDHKTVDIRAVSDSTEQNILPMWKVSGV